MSHAHHSSDNVSSDNVSSDNVSSDNVSSEPVSPADPVWPRGAPRAGARASRSRTVRAEDIALFTDLSGDRNPIHYDEELARATRFGGIVVQGGVTSAILNATVAEDLPGPGTVFLHVDWSFRAPVRPGDVITAAVEVLDVRSDKPITRLKTTVSLADGTVVLDGTALCYTMPLVTLARTPQ
jgi:acyl dehydratase